MQNYEKIFVRDRINGLIQKLVVREEYRPAFSLKSDDLDVIRHLKHSFASIGIKSTNKIAHKKTRRPIQKQVSVTFSQILQNPNI